MHSSEVAGLDTGSSPDVGFWRAVAYGKGIMSEIVAEVFSASSKYIDTYCIGVLSLLQIPALIAYFLRLDILPGNWFFLGTPMIPRQLFRCVLTRLRICSSTKLPIRIFCQRQIHQAKYPDVLQTKF